MALPILLGASMLPAAFGAFSAFGGGGLNSCCGGILGGRETAAGALTGSLVGGLLTGGNPLGFLVGGGVGALAGHLAHRHHHHHHCPHQHHNFPGPCGGGFGGPQFGGYYPGAGFPGGYGSYGGFPGAGYGGGFPGYGGGMPGYGGGMPGSAYGQGYQQGYAYGQGYQQGYAYGQGFQAGYQAGMQGYPPQGMYPGCMPPGGGWNCQPPQNQCYPPYPGTGNPGGQLCQEKEHGPINYRTSGGWNVQVNGDKVIITSPDGKQKIEHSGDPHEYVNGKHIKDWEGKDRTLVLPDGTKITMGATGANGVIQNTSIYDGDQNIQIDNRDNEVTHRSFNPYDTQMRERWQADGETSGVSYNRRGGINYTNYYTQDRNFGVRSNYKDLATTHQPRWWENIFRPFWNAGDPVTKDRYDDPRLLFT